MSIRKEFEEFCRRTRPPMSTARELSATGWGEYANNSTQAAWRAWQYLEKQSTTHKPKARLVIK